jgi:hypothetical protein
MRTSLSDALCKRWRRRYFIGGMLRRDSVRLVGVVRKTPAIFRQASFCATWSILIRVVWL